MTSRILAAIFAVALSSANAFAVDLSGARALPNPARVNRGDTAITFTNVGVGQIKIFNSAGRLVLERSIGEGETSFVWNLKNSDNNEVSSGIYVYFIESQGSEKTGKVGIIR